MNDCVNNIADEYFDSYEDLDVIFKDFSVKNWFIS